MRGFFAALFLLSAACPALAEESGRDWQPGRPWFQPPVIAETGIASVYGNGDGYAWKRTASGALMDPRKLTAAMLPPRRLGSLVTVQNVRTGARVVVKITDRGPFIKGRIIDLSPAAADVLGCGGLCQVTVQ